MPTVTETQNYLNAVKTPTIITPATLNAAIKTFVSSFGDARQQIAAWATLLQDSEMAEPDEVLRGKYEEAFQKFGALQRELSKLEPTTRAIVQVYQGFTALDAQMRTIASALGYTV